MCMCVSVNEYVFFCFFFVLYTSRLPIKYALYEHIIVAANSQHTHYMMQVVAQCSLAGDRDRVPVER